MPDYHENQWSGTEPVNEPIQRREYFESRIRQVSTQDDPEPELESQPDSGETEDVVEDDNQEPEEDSTASEEELARWAKSNSPEDDFEPNHVNVSTIIQTTIEPSMQQITDSDIIETAGETGDVVRDANQSGRDRFAAKAEEKSLDDDAAKDSGIHPA